MHRRLLALFCMSCTVSVAAPVFADAHVFGDPTITHWAPNRSYHVENYRLALHFDQAKGEVFGDEVVTLKPFASGFRKFRLDSSDLSIDSVSLLRPNGGPIALESDLQDPQLWITLDRNYTPADRLQVRIVYHGMPRFGLFFENPDAAYPNTPREIWTQGESEFNHHWFPCWDYPNDMATSETIITVPEGQVVVSNGKLVKVTRSGGGVTYDWVESVPHSSYLTSLAIGPWQKVHDVYKAKPVDYYVLRGTDEATVHRAFGLTPDMIAFFSRLTVEYPFEKYDQVAVPNFPFGGEENVSATTLQGWALQDAQASEDFPIAETVAHELAQHWFGDYAQGQDWADIWLNEGFATYLPALYTQYHEGYDAYRMQMLGYQQAAKAQDRDDYLRPIVDRHYNDGMDMFDSITHEKGAAVLDMLRYMLDGPDAVTRRASQDELFFRALRHYLQTHAAQATDTAGLVASLREATGRDLGQFFQEWVYMAGTPAYRVSAAYDPAGKSETVRVSQTQKGTDVPPVFHMPIVLVFHGSHGESARVQVEDDAADQSFTLPVAFEPLWVDFDPDGYIEKTVDFPQSVAMLAAAAEKDSSMRARLWAVGELGKQKGADADPAVDALQQVLANDAFYGVRAAAAGGLGAIGTPGAKAVLLANRLQADSRVRTSVMEALSRLHGDREAYQALLTAFGEDASYAVRAAAARGIGSSGMPEAFEVLHAVLAAKPEIHVARAIEAGLAATGDPRAVSLLLAAAQPGMPLRLRQSALAGLDAMQSVVRQEHLQEFTDLVGRTLHDPYFPLQQMGTRLVVSFRLLQFKLELEAEAAGAPTQWQRDTAKDELAQLQAAAGS
jgi:aminopeptidase N